MNKDNTMPLDIVQVMVDFLTALFSEFFPERKDSTVTQTDRKIVALMPNQDGTDSAEILVTKIDDTTASVVVYLSSKPDDKMYMCHYDQSPTDPKSNLEQLTAIGVVITDILIAITGPVQNKQKSPKGPPAVTVNIQDIVRVTQVETVQVVEQHYLSVSFDGQQPVTLAVPKDQLSAFTVGNQMAKLPYGFQLIERNPVIH